MPLLNKFHAKKTVVDGIEFDSKKEAGRYVQLKAMEAAGEIRDLDRQVKFLLIPAQPLPEPIVINTKTKKGIRKVTHRGERAVYYVADFIYEKDGQTVVEDVKGLKTPEYKIKRKLMLYKYEIQIHEV